VGVSTQALFETLPREYFYAYRTLIVDDVGQPLSEMRFFGNQRFLLVTKMAGGESDRVVPGSATIQIDDLNATITRGLDGVVQIDTSMLQDGVERPVLGELSGDDGLIGGERAYPSELAYEDGLVLGFALDDVTYTLLTNLTEDQAVWVVRQMQNIVSNAQLQADAGPEVAALTATPTPILRPPSVENPEQDAQRRFLAIQSTLARETYYGTLSTTGEIEGGDVVREVRFYGNNRFFVLTEWPDGDPERLEGEPVEFGSYPATLAEGLSGSVSLSQPHTLQDGTPILAGGGGGGGYGADDTQEWPDSIDYENGLRLTWVADGVRYMALTNNSRDDLFAFADAVNRVAASPVPIMFPAFPADFPLPGESPEVPTVQPQNAPSIYYEGTYGAFGVSMGAVSFMPLYMHYLPSTVIPGLGYPERGDAGDWVQFVVRNPDTGAMVVIRQSVDTGEGLPGEPNTTLDGVEGYLEENVSCTVDVPDSPNPMELGSSGGGGNFNSLSRLTFDCVEPSARYVTVFEGVRVEVIVSGMESEEAIQIVEGLYAAD
jgi:hypothetical protein